MKRSVSIAIIICLFLALFTIPAVADGEKKSGLFTYKLKGNGNAVITDFDWNANGSDDIYVPRQIDGYNVTEIGTMAFSSDNANAENIVGDEVVVILPDTITVIADKAFFCTNITSCNIPSSIQLIGSGAFAGCKKLSQHSVDVNSTVFATIDGVLYNKNEKSLLSVPASRSIDGKYSFSIPDGITKIEDYAFYGMKLADISIPATVNTVGEFAFAYAELSTNTSFLGVEVIEDYAFSHSSIKGLSYPIVESIGEYAFEYASSSENGLALPSTLKNLGVGVFKNYGGEPEKGYIGISYIDLSNTQLKTIPESAFLNCSMTRFNDGNDEIILPSCLSTIEAHAFEGVGCTDRDGSYSFEPVRAIIPANVKSIKESAFEKAGVVLEFEEKSQLVDIGDKCFYSACIWLYDGDKVVDLPEGLETLGSKAFYCYNISALSLPSTIKSIGDDVVDRSSTKLEVIANTYGAIYASENGYSTNNAGGEDTSWLNN